MHFPSPPSGQITYKSQHLNNKTGMRLTFNLLEPWLRSELNRSEVEVKFFISQGFFRHEAQISLAPSQPPPCLLPACPAWPL